MNPEDNHPRGDSSSENGDEDISSKPKLKDAAFLRSPGSSSEAVLAFLRKERNSRIRKERKTPRPQQPLRVCGHRESNKSKNICFSCILVVATPLSCWSVSSVRTLLYSKNTTSPPISVHRSFCAMSGRVRALVTVSRWRFRS